MARQVLAITGFILLIDLLVGVLDVAHPVAAGLVRWGVSPVHPVTLKGGAVPRIVGPESIEVGEGNPWLHTYFLVKLVRREVTNGKEDFTLVCAGSLIRPNKVLTAAHCLGGSRGVRVGDYVKVGGLTIQDGFTALISKAVVHPQYIDGDSEQGFDLAVLTIGNPPTTAMYDTGNVRKAGINRQGQDAFSQFSLTVAGWGRVSGAGDLTLSETLRQVSSRTTDWAKCREVSAGAFGNLPANAEDLLVCASSSSTTATCLGDSGGPLFRRTVAPSGRPNIKIVGVLSFAYDSPVDRCPPGSPSFFTRVDVNVDWILSQLDPGWQGWVNAP